MAEQLDRWRSFCERYVIERSPSFRPGFEKEDAWTAVMDAKDIYKQIAAQAADMREFDSSHAFNMSAGQAPGTYAQQAAQAALPGPSDIPGSAAYGDMLRRASRFFPGQPPAPIMKLLDKHVKAGGTI